MRRRIFIGKWFEFGNKFKLPTRGNILLVNSLPIKYLGKYISYDPSHK